MVSDPDEIGLQESHVFEVTVRDGEQRFAGQLSLSPERVSLRVTGEEDEDRRCCIQWFELQILRCDGFSSSFILFGLRCILEVGRSIQHFPKSRSYFEVHLEADYVFYFPKTRSSQPVFYGLDFRFSKLRSWLGNTVNQEKIVQEYRSGAQIFDKPELFEEFLVPAGEGGTLGIGYSASIYHSSPEFKAGIKFPPTLFFAFGQPKDATAAINAFIELRTFVEFLAGGELDAERVMFRHNGFGSFNGKASLYYPTGTQRSHNSHSLILFPLGRNLRWEFQELPEFPLECFDVYFRLSKKERAWFVKYGRYRRLANAEERFLGYFRILESICYKTGSYLDNNRLRELASRAEPFLNKYFGDRKGVKRFLARLLGMNNSKYNTEKCIGDFLATIPSEISIKWKYQRRDITTICKLRNDISHANDYDVLNEEIAGMAKFCEVLLVLGLLLKLGVSMESAIAVVGRIDAYFQVAGANAKTDRGPDFEK